jgi:hypothetical protein
VRTAPRPPAPLRKTNNVCQVKFELKQLRNGAPTLGTQNQAVDFIRADPELCRAVAAWAKKVEINEAMTAPRQRLPFDALYGRVRAFLERTMAPSVFL